jgi:FAD/FMN-containing dehydrogenase
MTSATDMSTFGETFGGEILRPGDDGYDTARALWNGDHDRRPALIARPNDAAQVASAIRFGRESNLELAIRGGGHSFAGHGVCDDGLMIDLSGMRAVTVDPVTRRARCGGGTTWADLDAATQEHGLAVTGGVISHTGVAGLTLGGGIGWLTRLAGLSCDNLVSAQVVTADGHIVTASAQEQPDLHWALRGGGGNFGVVTEFEFALHDIGPIVNLGLFFWDADKGADVFRFARDYLATLPEGMGTLMNGINAPPAPFVPEQYHFAPGFVLAVVGWGSPEDHASAIAPVRDTLPPSFELVTPIPYAALQQMLDAAGPWGILGYEKALYLDELSDAAIDVVVEHFPRKTSPMSLTPIFPLGGAYHRPADADTAFGGSRAAKWVFNIAGLAPERALLDVERGWVRDYYDALLPHASGSGTYINFLNDADESRVRASYGAEKYDRLARIKAEFDPDNVFHRNANIRPATTGASS